MGLGKKSRELPVGVYRDDVSAPMPKGKLDIRKRGYSLIQERNLQEVFTMFSGATESELMKKEKAKEDAGGKLSEKKIRGLVETLTGTKPRGSIVKDLMNEFSSIESGKIDYSDFVNVFETKLTKQESDLESAFKMFDQNGDGRITFDEAKRTLKALGENMSDSQIRELIKQGDKTGDGTINYEEFKTFFGVLSPT